MLTKRYAVAAVVAISAYYVMADGGGHGHVPHADPHAHAPVHHEPAVSYSEPQYYSPPTYGAPSYGGYQQPEDPLLPNLYPAAVIGGLGALGFAYFVNRIDDGYNKSLHAFEALHHNVDHRLEHLEDAIYNRGKEQKKLDFKTKMLCKFANLFNNPTYEICNDGFDAGQVVGPTGSSGYGGRAAEMNKNKNMKS